MVILNKCLFSKHYDEFAKLPAKEGKVKLIESVKNVTKYKQEHFNLLWQFIAQRKQAMMHGQGLIFLNTDSVSRGSLCCPKPVTG